MPPPVLPSIWWGIPDVDGESLRTAWSSHRVVSARLHRPIRKRRMCKEFRASATQKCRTEPQEGGGYTKKDAVGDVLFRWKET